MSNGTIVVIDAERTRAAEIHVKKRLANGECVACPTGEVGKHIKRGLCGKCHARWMRERAKLSNATKRAEFDADCYRKGILLDSHEISDLNANHENVISDLRKELTAK